MTYELTKRELTPLNKWLKERNTKVKHELLNKLILKVQAKMACVNLMIPSEERNWQLKSLKGYLEMLKKELNKG